MKARRTDSNQKEIVDALRKVGVQVIVTNTGNDFPDLALAVTDEWTLAEIKSPTAKFYRGQIEFIANAQAPVAIFTDVKQVKWFKDGTCWGGCPCEKTREACANFLNRWQGKTIRIKKFLKEAFGN